MKIATTSTFRDWLTRHIDELDRLYDHPDPGPEVWERCAAIADAAGDIAARLGFPSLHAESRKFGGMAEPPGVKTFLAQCVETCRSNPVELQVNTGGENSDYSPFPNGRPFLTEDEATEWLNLKTTTLRDARLRGEIEAGQFGRQIVYTMSDLFAWYETTKG